MGKKLTAKSPKGMHREGKRVTIEENGKAYLQKRCWWGKWGTKQEIKLSTLLVR